MKEKPMKLKEAIELLQRVNTLREEAYQIVETIKERAPYGSYQDLWWLLFTEFQPVFTALRESRLFGDEYERWEAKQK